MEAHFGKRTVENNGCNRKFEQNSVELGRFHRKGIVWISLPL